MKALQEAIEVLGGMSAAARILDVSREALRRWLEGINRLTPERAIDIERATSRVGKPVVCERLCLEYQWERDAAGRVMSYRVAVAPEAKNEDRKAA